MRLKTQITNLLKYKVMEPLLYYLLRASIVMALFYGFYKLFFGRNTFHRANRALLILIVVLISILPVFRFKLLSNITPSEFEANIFNFSNIEVVEQINSQQQQAVFPWVQILLAMFVTGIFYTIIRYLIGVSQIRKIIGKSEKQSISNNVILCVTDSNISPFSWWRYIVLSRKNLSESNLETIISHEKAHIILNHSMDMGLIDLFTSFFWFNPFSWLLRREIQTVHEYQADEQVLNNGIDAKQYQFLLIRKSVGEDKFALANNFRRHNLHKRITMMIKTKTNKSMKWSYAIFIPVLFLAITSLSIPNLNAKVIENDPTEKIKVIGYGSMDSLDVISKGVVFIEIDGENRVQLRADDENQPLYILDGVKISNDEFADLDPNDIESISVFKDAAATKLYGSEGENGVISITSKNNQIENINNLGELKDKLLIIVDGEKMPKGFDVNTISTDEIDEMFVIKGKEAVDEYGEGGKNGVIVINKKKN